MLAMNRIGYDAMVVGNHEFNFGLESLGAARASARFPWLSANTETGGSLPPFAPYLLKTVAGVKVAVIGVTTAAIPQWEKPENIRGLSWLAPEEGVRRALAGARGREARRDPGRGPRRPRARPGDRGGGARTSCRARTRRGQIAERFPELAAVIYGHSHRREPGRRVGGVLLVQPRNWAMERGARRPRARARAGRALGGSTGATSRLLPVTPETPADPRILELARPYHEAAERYLDTPVAESAVELSGRARPLRGQRARRRDPRGAAALRRARR